MEGNNNFKAWHYAQWQVAAFRLPTAQQEAWGWWDPPTWFIEDSMPIAGASNAKDIWVIRGEKTLALVWVLQACVEESGTPASNLWDATQELQRCMAPLMTLSGDDIVETSLL